MTQLVPQTDDLTIQDEDNLATLLTRVASRKVVAEPETPRTEPNLIQVTPEQKKALRNVARDLGAVELPSERRTISLDEAVEYVKITKDVKVADKVLKAAVAGIKTAVFNHFDVTLEADNPDEDLPYDEKSGHYLVDCELIVPGTGLKFSRELKQGSPDLTADHLLALYEAGKLTRAEYLKATKTVRQVDEDGLMKVLRKRADLLADIEEIIEPGKVTASFWVREMPKVEGE